MQSEVFKRVAIKLIAIAILNAEKSAQVFLNARQSVLEQKNFQICSTRGTEV